MSAVRHWLTARNVRLDHDAHGRLVLRAPSGASPALVWPVRAFPLTDPEHFVSIVDEDGRELVCIEDLDVLSADTRAALELELERRTFLPVIERILHVSGTSEPVGWGVATDRGETELTLASEEDIHRLGPHCLLVVDAEGGRYLIPDTRSLNQTSRRLLGRFL